MEPWSQLQDILTLSFVHDLLLQREQRMVFMVDAVMGFNVIEDSMKIYNLAVVLRHKVLGRRAAG